MSEEPSKKALVEFGRAPQNALNSDKPGSYELAIRASKAEVAPGDTVDLEVFITGYGTITSAKLVFYPPPYFINSAWSTATFGLGLQPENQFYWGKDERTFDEAGITISLAAGVKVNEWPESSLFFDMMHEPHKRFRISQIVTETKLPRAPVEFSLHVRDKTPSGKSIPSGAHRLDFYLTYFNGQEWKTTSQTVDLTVPNFFKRHEGWTWTVGIVGFLVTVADPIIALLR